MDTMAETRTMSEDRASTARVADQRTGGASARAGQSTGSAIFEGSGLSPRECGVLALIGQGYSNKRVARTLGISTETVKSHVKRVFLKLDVNTRAYAVARAQSLGLFGLGFVRPRGIMGTRESGDSLNA